MKKDCKWCECVSGSGFNRQYACVHTVYFAEKEIIADYVVENGTCRDDCIWFETGR